MPFHITGIILAAGCGSRFDPSGQQYKLTQELANQQPVIVASCLALESQVDALMVVDGERGHELDDSLRLFPGRFDRVHCTTARRGMGASLKAAIDASGPTDAWVIGLGDMPYVSGTTIEKICAALRSGALIVRPFYRGRPGHPVGFSSSLQAELLELPDSAGAAVLLKRHSDEVVRIDVDDAGCITDIDYPNDIRQQ